MVIDSKTVMGSLVGATITHASYGSDVAQELPRHYPSYGVVTLKTQGGREFALTANGFGEIDIHEVLR